MAFRTDKLGYSGIGRLEPVAAVQSLPFDNFLFCILNSGDFMAVFAAVGLMDNIKSGRRVAFFTVYHQRGAVHGAAVITARLLLFRCSCVFLRLALI